MADDLAALEAELARRKQQPAAPQGGGGEDLDALQAELDRRRRGQMVEEFRQEPYWSRVGQRGKDELRAGLSGVTFGLADRAAAGADTLFNGMSWDEANTKQERLRQDAKARLGDVIPGTYEALDFAGGLLLPFKSAKVPGITAESGLRGGVSSFGHGEDDPVQIAKDAAINGLVGSLTSGAANVGRYAQKLAPYAAKAVGGYGKSWTAPIAALFSGHPVTAIASAAAKSAAPEAAKAVEQFGAGTPIDPQAARQLLSQLTTSFTRQGTNNP
jgi:hypothetical protein